MKKVVSILTLVFMCVFLLGTEIKAEEIIASGNCGESVTYQITGTEEEGYTLSINGSGEMQNYSGTSSPWYSYNIKSVIINSGVTRIGDNAFLGCSKLTSVSLPDSVTSIGNYAFKYCSNLTSINFHEKLTSIGIHAFFDCSSLTSISLPDSIKSIGEGAFKNCSGLMDVSFPKGLTSIEYEVFSGCSSLTSINLPAGVTSIGAKAFCDCSSVTSINLPDSLMSIKHSAFCNCDSLTSLIIPKSVTFIGANAVGMYYSGPYDKYFPVNGFIIYGYKGSGTELYAKDNGIIFQSMDDGIPPVLKEKIRRFSTRLYTIVLGRNAEEDGLNWWVEQLATGQTTCANAVNVFVSSDEFKNKNLSNEEIVRIMYVTMLDRESDEAGLAYWNNLLENGVTPSYIVNGFASSNEFEKLCSDYGMKAGSVTLLPYRDQNSNVTAFLARCYTKILSRKYEENGLEWWCEQIITKKKEPLDAAKQFVASEEFLEKNYNNSQYLEVLYRTFFDREYDEDGMNWWLKQMTNGMSRETVLDGFAGSNEFKEVMARFGL